MGRTHHIGRREGQRSRSSSHGRPHFLVFSTHPGAPPSEHVSASGGDTEPAGITVASPSSPLTPRGDESSPQVAQFQTIQTTTQVSRSASASNFSANRRAASSGIRYRIVSKCFLLWLLCCKHFFYSDHSFTESPLVILHLQIWIELGHPNFSPSQKL